MWLCVLYVLCWLVKSSVCDRVINDITTEAMSIVSENISVYQALESTSVANPKKIIQGLGTVGSFTNIDSESTSELYIAETHSEERSAFLKGSRSGHKKQNSTRKTTDTNEDLMLNNSFSGIVCENQRESCNGLCNATNAMYNGMKCSCDIHCQVYRTCCEDFEHYCPNLWLEAHQTYGNVIDLNIECLESYSLGYLVIAACPIDQRFQNDDRKKCENSSLEQPISVGDLHFKNIDCLRCNGFNDSNGLLWEIIVSLHAENSRNWLEGPGFLKSEPYGTYVNWNPHNPNVKQCSKNIIGKCPESTSNYMASKCKGINSYVKVSVNNSRLFDIYRNKYCIECNIGNSTPCKVMSTTDFKGNRHSHLSTLVKWTSSPDFKSQGMFEGSSRTKWKKMKCSGSFQNWSSLQCSVTECWNTLEPVNGICPLSKSVFYVLFVINWNHIYLNDVNGTDHIVIPSTIKQLLKIYVQNVYLTNNLSVWATNKSVKFLVTLENENKVSVKDIRADIIPIIKFGLSEQRFHGEFSFCIVMSFKFRTSFRNSCRVYMNYTIPEISPADITSCVANPYPVAYWMAVIIIGPLKTLQSLV
ncbi:hypothetical protein LOTGIDRAFT_158534 [Lottia gigantea]|uniref:SMB domain-containing protein n=1 Tax=Lottia gigantea TaxID=225164 RepID=V4AWQ9_LOTGI|nr:hypothetical protein LOTGIDRAFT_158534 [Lottia gigantea]ESO99450.1 hypothetical protein LOTGIDRAFT_158534 [Lottia gigantea]